MSVLLDFILYVMVTLALGGFLMGIIGIFFDLKNNGEKMNE